MKINKTKIKKHKAVEVISKNIEDTAKIANGFVQKIIVARQGSIDNNQYACVVGLSGNLGTGKTTFTQTVAKILGIKDKVISPTFVIMKRYGLKNKVFKNFFHLDAYRLKNEKELIVLNWQEIISNPENLVFVEWPELIKKGMPKKHHKIKISHTKEGHRKFKFSDVGHQDSQMSNIRKRGE